MATEKKSVKETVGSALGSCLGVIILLAIAAFFINREKSAWTGIFYPQIGNTNSQEFKKNLKSLQACRDWAQSLADEQDLTAGTWDYDCGTGCTFDETTYGTERVDVYTCEQLEK